MDYELILIRPDELYLKSEPVMRSMMKQLAHNIKVSLKENDVVFDYIQGNRLQLMIKSPDIEEVVDICKNIPGISIVMPAVEVGLKMDTIKQVAYELAKEQLGSFAVRAKRSDKGFEKTSKDIEKEVGAYIISKSKAKVNLTKPKVTIFIELLKDKALISASKERGLGGLPVGVSGKVLCLVNEKDDLLSPFLLLRRGCEVVLAYENQKVSNSFKYLRKFAYGTMLKSHSTKDIFNLAKELKINAVALPSRKPSLLTNEILIFEPLVGLSTKQLNSYKKIIFK